MKILAGIVTYNPDIELLERNIAAISPQVNEVIIVDNGSKNLKEIEQGISAKLIKLEENKGIAFALNIIGRYATENSFEWFMTLDQDTIVSNDIIGQYLRYIGLPSAGMLTSNYLNKSDQLMVTSKWNKGYSDFSEVPYCITSASFVNTTAFQKTDGFDSKMFIDLVDYDMNFSLAKVGYLTYWINVLGFKHEVGEASVHKLFGFKISTSNHNPIRRYYLARNGIYLLKKYKPKMNVLRLNVGNGIVFLKILLFEKDKKKNLGAMLKGVKDGFGYRG